jgi:hypothetical protein
VIKEAIAVLCLVVVVVVPVFAGGQPEVEEEDPAPVQGRGERINISPEEPNGEDPVEEIPPFTEDDVILPIWDLVLHDSDRGPALEGIAAAVEMGYLPVGLHVESGRPHMVLYAFNPGIPVTEVALQAFEDPDRTPEQLAQFISSGWLPMALAVPDGNLTALMIRTPIPFDDWGVVFTEINLAEMGREVEERYEQGYTLWALGNDGDRMWLFFVDEAEGAPNRETRFMVFPFVEALYTPEIDRLTQQGWFPWAVTLAEDQMIMVFTREDEE